MNRRERTLAALKHREPDRVPIDLGGCDSSSITAIAYNRLKSYLGIHHGSARVFEPYQQVVDVEESVLSAVQSDVRALMILPRRWSAATLPDGSACEIPAGWNPRRREDGSQVVTNQDGDVVALMPASGLYFEPVHAPLKDCRTVEDLDRFAADIAGFDLPAYLDESFADTAARAADFRREGDHLLTGGNFGGHVIAAAQILRGWDTFLVDLIEQPAFANALMSRLVDSYCERFDRYWDCMGRFLDVVMCYDDLGTQAAPFLSPDLYRAMIKPHHQRLYTHIKRKSGAFVFLHSDGSIYRLIPDLIEAGVDILNPIQVTAAEMDPVRLKREFGDRLVFWGGGCDTQRVLPRGSRQEIRDEVKRRIDELAPGGGFVFTQIHNILPDVPPKSIMTMYEAVWEFGEY
jgi:uroporphyrinogen decarboxylase